MHIARPSFSAFSGVQSLATSRRARALFATVAAAAAVIASVVVPTSQPAEAHTTYAPVRQASYQFLTLPFNGNSDMSILSGWYYSSSGGFHGGIDYVNGNVNNVNSWDTFPVIASADGMACGNCSSRQGNAVWIKHEVNGSTYYSYYGHLASISANIPRGSQSNTVYVKRGQYLGMAGDTGAGRGILHLHFALYNANSTPVDPYSIGKLRQYYPQPTDNTPGIGWFLSR